MRAVRKAFSNWLGVYAVVYVAFLYLPVLLLPIFSVNDSAVPVFPLKGFTFKWYESLGGNDIMLGAAWNSLVVGVSSAILATILGICAARAITRYRFAGQRPMSALIMAPLVLPEIIIAISLLLVMLQLGLEPVAVHRHTRPCGDLRSLFAMSVLDLRLRRLRPEPMRKPRLDLGESAFGTFRRVTLPMVAPAIISSLLVAFTISLDEFIVAFFLSRHGAYLADLYLGPVALRRANCRLGACARHDPARRLRFILLTVAEIFRRRAARHHAEPMPREA